MPTRNTLVGAEGGSLQRHVLAGTTVLTALVVGLGWWSATTQISGAIVALGTVVVEGGTKLIQHRSGGVVAEILVDSGDHVVAGDLLIRLEGTTVVASRNVTLSQLRHAFARLGRLQAEIEGASKPVVSADLPAAVADAAFEGLLKTQRDLMAARANARKGRQDQILRQLDQARSKIAGLVAQRVASDAQLGIVRQERADLEELYASGLVNSSRVNDLALRQHQLEGALAQVEAGIGELEATIAERQSALVVEGDNLRLEALAEQQDVRAEIAQLLQQQIALDAQLRELDIRAPMAGVVHNSIVHTVGGVIGAGETAMSIIPPLGRTVIDVRISPLDIEAVTTAREVLLKFPGLDPRNTPDLVAEITSVSPDLSMDPTSGAQFYVARTVVRRSELDRFSGHVSLVAGMPVEAFIKTSDRTVLDFLLKPLADLADRAFRED